MPVQIRVPEESSYDDLVALRMARVSPSERTQVGWIFRHGAELDYLDVRAAYDDGLLVGWGNAVRGPWYPPGIAMVAVTVAHEHEGAGCGTALARALVEALPGSVERIGTAVRDDDPASLAYAGRRGMEITQHGIASELPLVDLPEPVAIPGVLVEDVSTLEFPDEEAVEAMLADSQTNPEAEEGFVSTLSDFRAFAAKSGRPIAALARVGGAPAAIVAGEINNDVLGIDYTGVGKPYRGRNLAFALKQFGHRLAADAGATLSRTMNEAGNAGIRHINAKLGYRTVYGTYRLRVDRSDLRW